ncbi:multi-sensor hybrid histidine kinase [Chitinispirillum alkaliphilum]|nr:multi-sensor hybrid histidine kinase [Chitinispirillum alkaliphilum]
MKILIADGDYASRLIIKSVVEMSGYEPLLAENGKQALEIIDGHKPAIAIIEWTMPGLNDGELCKKIRFSSDDFQPYIIIITARKCRSDVAKGLDSGADDYIVKPFDIPELKARVGAGRRIVDLQNALRGKIDELNSSREYQHKLFMKSKEGIAIYKLIRNEKGEPCDYLFLEVNPAFEKNNGIRADQIIGSRITDIFPGIQKTDLIKKFGEIVKSGIPCDFEFYFKPLQRYFSISAYRIGEDQFVVIHRDFTAQKNAEKSLRKSEAKCRRIYESIQDIYFETDIEGNILEVSPSAEKLSGYTCEELSRTHMSSLFCNDEDKQRFINALVSNRDIISNYSIDFKNKGGKVISCSVSAEMVRDKNGAPKKIFGTIRDITDIKKTTKQNRMLEEQISFIRRLEITGQLAGGIAHDFNNILGGIIGYADLLSGMQNFTSREKRYIGQIITSAQRGSDLTSQLLSFARKGSYRLAILDMNKVVSRLKEILDVTMNKKIKVQSVLSSLPCRIEGDATQLENAIMNLALNARDAMDEGVIRLETDIVYLSKKFAENKPYEVQHGRYVKISVKDTGCGMDKRVMEKIFEPYFTTKSMGKGTGLGLAGVYGCVKQHNGYIDVVSEPGRGSEFKIYLPYKNSPQNQKEGSENLQ